MISSYSIPSAISKAIAQKLGEKEYRNAHRLFHGAMILSLIHILYAVDEKKNLANLSKYAKEMKLYTKVMNVMEVLLNG